jgi:hypothetical protein
MSKHAINEMLFLTIQVLWLNIQCDQCFVMGRSSDMRIEMDGCGYDRA